MPQLDFSTYPNQIFWLLVALVTIYLLLTRIAIPRIAGSLAARRSAITSDIAAAEEFRRRAREAEEAFNAALADARAEANRIAEATRAEIQREVDAATQRADAEIAARTAESERRIAEIRVGAMEAVEEVARDTATALVAHVAPGLGDADIGAAISARLKEERAQ